MKYGDGLTMMLFKKECPEEGNREGKVVLSTPSIVHSHNNLQQLHKSSEFPNV